MTETKKRNPKGKSIMDIDEFAQLYNCDKEILSKFEFMLKKMLSKHASLQLRQFRLYFPEGHKYSDENILFQEFLKKIYPRVNKNSFYLSIFWIRNQDFYRQNHSYRIIMLTDIFYMSHYVDNMISFFRRIWTEVLEVEWRTKNIFYEDMPRNGLTISEHDPNKDTAIFNAMDLAAQMTTLCTKDAPEEIERFGFNSNSINMKKEYKPDKLLPC